jgi:hypothetical protein
MPPNKTLFLFCILLSSVISCFSHEDAPGIIPLERTTFYAVDLNAVYDEGCINESAIYSYYPVEAYQIISGTHGSIYIESNNLDKASQIDIHTLLTLFDDSIYDLITQKFVTPSIWEEHIPITILLLDIRDPYSSSFPQYVQGYFDPMMFFDFEYGSSQNIYYMDLYPTDLTRDIQTNRAISTFAHEFYHMAHLSFRLFKLHPELLPDTITPAMLTDAYLFPQQLDIWVDEGIAQAAEHAFLEHPLMDLITFFKQDPGSTTCDAYPLSHLKDGWSLFTWWDSINDYALSYVFFQYLRIHSIIGGYQIFRDITTNPEINSFENILQVARAHQIISQNDNWLQLLGSFALAVVLREGEGIYGFKNQLTLDSTSHHPSLWETHLTGTVPLNPGGFLLIPMPLTQPSVPTEPLHYIGVDYETHEVDWDGLDGYKGDGLIILNAAPDSLGNPIEVNLNAP